MSTPRYGQGCGTQGSSVGQISQWEDMLQYVRVFDPLKDFDENPIWWHTVGPAHALDWT